MAEVDVFSTTLALFITLILSLVVLIVILGMARTRATRPKVTVGRGEPIADRAYNALVTSEAISNDMWQKGFESARASTLLSEARQAYYEGRHREAEDLSLEARALLIQLKEAGEVEATPAEEPLVEEEIPESKPLLGKQFPKNYLQAKFFMNLVKDSLKGKKGSSEKVKKARNLVKEARQAFKEERYTEALSLAISCNKLLRGEEESSEVEAEGQAVCPRCGAAVATGDVFCGKCGGRLDDSPQCPKCGSELEDEDNFCRKCGEAIETLQETR